MQVMMLVTWHNGNINNIVMIIKRVRMNHWMNILRAFHSHCYGINVRLVYVSRCEAALMMQRQMQHLSERN